MPTAAETEFNFDGAQVASSAAMSPGSNFSSPPSNALVSPDAHLASVNPTRRRKGTFQSEDDEMNREFNIR